jgi:ankyrin repeat protein/CRP-like cAMP-binding protein
MRQRAAAAAPPPPQPAMRARRGALAVSQQADLASLISERPKQIAILRRPPVQRTEADVDMLMSLCDSMRWLQSEVRRPEDRRALVRMLRYTYLGPGRTVVREGARGNDMFLVLSGRLQAKTISREKIGGATDETEIVLAELGPDDHFGELALINPLGTRAATVVTMQPTELLRIDRADFQQVTRVGAKASKMQANDAAGRGIGEEWRTRLRALHAAAFEGDTLGLQRAVMPEAEAAMRAVSERRRLEGFQRQLRAKCAQLPQLAGRLTALREGAQDVVTEVARVAKKEKQCRTALARAEKKFTVQGPTLTESEEKVMLGNIEVLRNRLRELKWSQRDNHAELANAREIAEGAKRALSTAEEARQKLEQKIEECRMAVMQANAVERLIDMRDTQGRTAAFLAAEAGHHGLLVLLLRHGAELHIPDNNGVSPLHIACRRGHVGVVRYLLGLDVRRLLEVEDSNAETPFYTACFEGHLAIVTMMLESSTTDVNKPSSAGTTPIFACVDHGNLDCVQLITEKGARNGQSVDFTRPRTSDGATPFYIACRHGDVSCVKYLAEHAPVSAREAPAQDGTTPIAIAACQGQLAVVRFLAQIGVNAETTNAAGNSPLHLAAAEGHLEVVQYLVDELHAPLFVRNKDGVDSFHAAVDASNAGAVAVVGWLAARPTPPAEAMKRTRLLQRRLRKADDVTDPLRSAPSAEVKAGEEDEAVWVAEEENRNERLARARQVSAALENSGGIWSMLSSSAATGGSKRAKGDGGSGSALNLLALMGEAEATGDAAVAAQGPSDDDIAAEMRAIEWNNIANGTTISEDGVTTAVRGKQLSCGAVYRRLLKARPEWGNSSLVPDLKERVRSLNESTRAAAAKRWLRYLAEDARNPDEPWAWVAPSAVFGEVLAASAGMAVPGPGTELAQIKRPVAAISDWATTAGTGGDGGSAGFAGGAVDLSLLRPQGREAIARSAMAAAEAHWARTHPEDEDEDDEGAAAAAGRRGKGSRQQGTTAGKQGRQGGGSSKRRGGEGVSFAAKDAASAATPGADAASSAADMRGDSTADGGGGGDDASAAWGRLRGRRNAVLAEHFTKSWTDGAQIESDAKPESVGDRANRQRQEAAAAAAADDTATTSQSTKADNSDSLASKGDGHAGSDSDEDADGATYTSGGGRFESRIAFISRVHRDHVEGLVGQTRLMTVASAAAQDKQRRDEARRAKEPGAAAARRRTSVLDLARRRKKMMRQ